MSFFVPLVALMPVTAKAPVVESAEMELEKILTFPDEVRIPVIAPAVVMFSITLPEVALVIPETFTDIAVTAAVPPVQLLKVLF